MQSTVGHAGVPSGQIEQGTPDPGQSKEVLQVPGAPPAPAAAP
jgi:hypothetical protein